MREFSVCVVKIVCEGVQCMCCEDKEIECVREFSVCVVKIRRLSV